MAYQQADLDALDAAIASGAKKIRYADGREVEYRTLAEMNAARATVAASLAGPAAQQTLGSDRTVAGYNSGLSRGTPASGWGRDWECWR